ncbi:unnamed protein product, partial [Hymenolepis diminuta]
MGVSPGTFHKSICGSFSECFRDLINNPSFSGFSSIHILSSPDFGNDPNMVTVSAILRSSESRQTFQLLSRVVESRVKLTWMPNFICRFTEVAPAGINTEIMKSNKLSSMEFHRFSTSSSRKLPRTISSKTTDIAIDLVNTFESRYAHDYESLIDDALRIHSSSSSETDLGSPHPTDYTYLRTRYMAILKSLFASQINWGRIVAMISFLRALCVILDTTPGSQV